MKEKSIEENAAKFPNKEHEQSAAVCFEQGEWGSSASW
jgi:hypothetical protein